MNRNRTHRFTRLWILACLLATCIAASSAFAKFDIVEVGHVQDIYGSPGIGYRALRLAIRDHLLYVGNDSTGLRIYDLSNPAAPVLISPQTNDLPVASFSLSGSYAYLANYFNGFSIFDISHPDQPLNLSRTELQGCSDISVSNGRAYIADVDGLSIFSVTNPAAPVLLSHTHLPHSPDGITLSGKYAFLMSFFDGFRIFDVSNTSRPVELSHLNSAAPSGGNRMVIRGRYAYMANGYDGFRIFDISNPSHPTSVGQVGAGACEGIALNGNYAWLVDDGTGLLLYDISNPFHPAYLASAGSNHGAQSYDVAISGNYAYLANGRDGIRIYKFNLPLVPPPPVKQRPPANDNFLTATPILTQHAFITATNTLATRETFEPPIAGDTSGHSLWWTWNSVSPRSMVINTYQNEHPFPMAVYGLIPGKGFTKVAEGYDSLRFNTRPNSRYWLVIGSDRGVTGTFTLSFDQIPL